MDSEWFEYPPGCGEGGGMSCSGGGGGFDAARPHIEGRSGWKHLHVWVQGSRYTQYRPF
jgi:hypothetical protein